MEVLKRETDVVVIGAGISGLVAAKCMREDGFKVTVIERTGEIGGLWTFREHDYGVMRCTHINVSKYNYCFSDFPFPEDVADYPHHSDMAKYIVDYAQFFRLPELIRFHTIATKITSKDDRWEVVISSVEDNGHTLVGESEVIYCRFLIIASGHHAKPNQAKFPGQETFPGEIIHAVAYKDPLTNGLVGKQVLIVGIGNSAVDAAVDCATVGRCKSVVLSTRSGAWVIPNYIFGFPIDLYACRAFFLLPWRWANFILETIIKVVSGDPHRWGLNPKMKALQTQPTVSPTLINHIQRKNIKIAPNVTRIDGGTVHFVNGEYGKFDSIIYCTGYKIDLPYLSDDMRSKVLDEHSNCLKLGIYAGCNVFMEPSTLLVAHPASSYNVFSDLTSNTITRAGCSTKSFIVHLQIKLYKNVFSPSLGPTVAFIGFVQPASGGVLTMSETQARWFGQVCLGNVHLPPKHEMEMDMRREKAAQKDRWYDSERHTIQRDPIVYNDEIASFFGARPDIIRHPALLWRLLFSSCGAAQWRLQGPGQWSGAAKAVQRVPLTDLMHYSGFIIVIFVAMLLLLLVYTLLYVMSLVF